MSLFYVYLIYKWLERASYHVELNFDRMYFGKNFFDRLQYFTFTQDLGRRWGAEK